MAHIEIALAERLRAGADGAATVVGEATDQKAKKRAPRKAAGKATKKTARKSAAAKG